MRIKYKTRSVRSLHGACVTVCEEDDVTAVYTSCLSNVLDVP